MMGEVVCRGEDDGRKQFSRARHSCHKGPAFTQEQLCAAAELQLAPWHWAQQSLAGACGASPFREVLVGLRRYLLF